jgi:hypothetical protein
MKMLTPIGFTIRKLLAVFSLDRAGRSFSASFALREAGRVSGAGQLSRIERRFGF